MLQTANIRAALRDVSYPAVRCVPGHVLRYPQILDLQVGHIVHGYLKVHSNRPDLPANAGRARLVERHLDSHGLLRVAGQFLHRPQHLAILGRIFSMRPRRSWTSHEAARRSGRALRQRQLECDVGSKVILRHLSPNKNRNFNRLGCRLFDGGKDSEGGLEVPGKAVVENNKLAIRRSELQRPGVLKFVEVDAFVEVDIIKNDRTIWCRR